MKHVILGVFALLGVIAVGFAQVNPPIEASNPEASPVEAGAEESYEGKVVEIEVGGKSLMDLRRFEVWATTLGRVLSMAAAMALGHGLQDAQKTMGVIFLALLAGEYVDPGDPLPLWVIFAAAAAISAGTWAGGWRIMRTLGRRIIHLDPARGFASESVAASVLYTTAYVFEAPISTTHTITSAVMGAGATKRFSAVRWGVARSIVTAWVLTFPMAGGAAALVYFACRYVFQLP